MNNQELGKLIGVSYSMASRLQSGDRTPGIDTMRQIANVFDFPIDLQAEARAAGHYHTLFSEAIRRYEVDREPVTAAAVAPDGG